MENKILNFPEFSILSRLPFQPVTVISKYLNFESSSNYNSELFVSFCQN
jgi:hypothetical protein